MCFLRTRCSKEGGSLELTEVLSKRTFPENGNLSFMCIGQTIRKQKLKGKKKRNCKFSITQGDSVNNLRSRNVSGIFELLCSPESIETTYNFTDSRQTIFFSCPTPLSPLNSHCRGWTLTLMLENQEKFSLMSEKSIRFYLYST